jgi:transposase
MGRALSVDLRERVMAAVDGGMSCRAAAARFGVGVSSAIRWRQQQLAKGDLLPGRPGGNVRSSAIDAHRAFLLSLVEEQSDLTLDEIREALAARGTPVSIAAVWRFFDRHQITRKKSRSTRPSRTAPTS